MTNQSGAFVIACAAILIAGISNVSADGVRSLTGSVICGYQGWQCCPGDPAGIGWTHWAVARDITQSTVNFDYWPDMSYFSGCPEYAAGSFTYPDGAQAKLYSPVDAASVNVQFRMMAKHGIDGVALQCFAGGLPKPDGSGGWTAPGDKRWSLVMANVQAAAHKNKRTWCMEYDLSGVPAENIIPVVTHHWTSLVASGVTSSPEYLHENGLPVLLVFGYFYNDRNHAVAYPPGPNPIGSQLVDWFHAPGKYRVFFVASGAWNWPRTTDQNWIDMMKKPDGLQGWEAGNNPPWNSYGPQARWCAENHQLWLPEIYPGFHWFNLMTNTHNPTGAKVFIDRQNGEFLWRQFYEASRLGAKSAFVGMFDEFDEGTAIQPATSTPPSKTLPDLAAGAIPPPWWTTNPNNSQFDDFGNANGTDWYLRLTGCATSYIATGKPVPVAIPIGNR